MPPFESDSYTAVFGGQNRSPAQIDYVFYQISKDIHTQWPFLAADGAYIAPAKLDISAININLQVFLPDASIASVGQDCLVRNQGVNRFTVVDFDGNTIINIQPGESWLVWITDDSTVDGVWSTVQFGASTSAANAAALAGAGLRANVTLLDQDLLTTQLLGNHIVSLGDRALVLQNNGGTVTYAVDPLVPPVNGWFCYLINAGTGNVTVTVPLGVTIDGGPSKLFAPAENAILFADGSNLHTLGYGRSLVNTVTGISIAMSGGTQTLSAPQIAAQVQNYVGTLTSNQILDYGGVVGYWFVYNHTTGPFTVRARTNSLDAGVIIPQNTFTILRSDGTNMNVAFTATTGTVTSVKTTVGELVGGEITSSGTLGLADTPVTPGAYGTPSRIPKITLDHKGRATLASDALAAITASQVTDLVALLNQFVPTATIFSYAGTTLPPVGWLLCDGAILVRASYSALFAAIGTTYNVGGETATQFRLPDTRGRVLAGVDSGAGRLTGTYFGATTLGAGGGSEFQYYGFHVPALGVGVGGWYAGGAFTGTTAGSQSVSITGNTTSGSDVNTNATGGGSTVASYNHGHTISGSGGTGGEALSIATFGASGGTAAYDGNTNNGANVQPTLIIRHIIKI